MFRNAAPLFLLLFSGTVALAQQPHLTLSAESQNVRWQDEFILTLEIVGAPATVAPEIMMDGLDGFELKGTGKNLLPSIGGSLTKWILTYTLTAIEPGTFKLGPARFPFNGRNYYSNILLITVEAPRQPKTEPVPSTPLVRSAAEVGDKVQLVWEAQKRKVYRTEGVVLTLKLLSQLMVENLRHEVDFPGFLKYDFPFSAHPKAEWVQYRGRKFAVYRLQKFLLFPLNEGRITIPSVSSQIKIRVPSGRFPGADLLLNVNRSSSPLSLEVLPVPASALVGTFVLKNEIVSSQPRSKILRLILEGDGQLTTFDFPEMNGPGFQTRVLSTSTISRIQEQTLRSRKVTEWEIAPNSNTISIVLSTLSVPQLDPVSGRLSALVLPPLRFQFEPPGRTIEEAVPLPQMGDNRTLIAYFVVVASSLLPAFFFLRSPSSKKTRPGLSKLIRQKSPNLQVSRRAAQRLYRQIAVLLISIERQNESLVETFKMHLPPNEWQTAEKTLQRLESTAFSQSKETPVTYGELKTACKRMEKQWQA